MAHQLLIVDDDPRHRQLYTQTLAKAGFDIIEADSAGSAVQKLTDDTAMVISDVQMPGQDGISFLQQVRVDRQELPFLLVTAFPDVRDAVAALKLGAVDYLEKPVDLDELVSAVQDTLGIAANETAANVPAACLEGIIAESRIMRNLLSDCYRVAASNATVLLTGESGTGKEVLAGFVHRCSPRRERRFAAVNCAAIPANLLASELFGHVPGAFTGAEGTRDGWFREAHGGTLFLDEIGEMPLELQPTLLRVLETGVITPLGSNREESVDIRLIAATNRNLAEDVEDKRFRQDLFYRLNVIAFEIPPLRERPEDLLPLARHFLRRGETNRRLSPAAARALQVYHWPGNVRELANAMERARVLSSSEVILPEHLPPAIRQAPMQSDGSGSATTLAQAEREAIIKALETTEGNRTKAAEVLGISRRALIYKIKRFGID